MKRSLRAKQGFSLLELMVVVGIMGIIMSFAGFDYVKMAPQRRLEGAAYDVVTLLRQARMFAASGNTRSRVTVAGNDITVWVDRNNDGAVGGDETFTRTIDSKITLAKSPDTGTFTSRGMFECSYYAMVVSLSTSGAGLKKIFIYPSGQVDIY